MLLMHWPLRQRSGSIWHSLMSEGAKTEKSASAAGRRGPPRAGEEAGPEALTPVVGGVARAERAHLFEVDGPGKRAELALRPPPAAHVAAALGLGDADAAGGRLLAHGLEDLGVAVALPVVCERGDGEGA